MLNTGIIGAGRIGKVHGESITYHVKNARVAAMADPYWTDDSRKWAREMGIPTYDDYHDILKDPAIDAVMICSSTQTHAPISIEAIRAGKHVFCEKPISRELSEIKSVMKELEHSHLKYQVGFNRRFDHNFHAVREIVESGKIGDVHIVKITSRDPDSPPIEYVKVSGGIFLDMTIHDFDMVRYLTGSDVEEIYANSAVLVDPGIGEAGDVDTAIITMKLANGALAVIDNSRKAVYGYDQRAEVFGSKGQAAVSNDLPSSAVVSTSDGITGEKPLYFFLERYMESFATEVTQFTESVLNDTPVAVTVNDGLQAVLIAKAAAKSVKEHRPVKLSEIQF
ncbi:inositol 2-dehydrogenase [Clostridium sp. KNHs216]|uniref:inositol 2-dehydrogenase n=1 Tax=Clostridium sp. KNHs216 TaxID=1550235 RepID=UPI0011513E4A|nr:inositol 2-dehydrogenase [Clostridium sp. KNHs216]TQI66608.1 myo-inositol 2-dehydrogenase [Clostridium sp. KNHs216]